jgi:hypothetical protein
MKKKTLRNYFELFEAKGFIKKKISSRKERGKDETLFEVDTYHSNV